jgi:MOSC domain-containing protein YiiM
VLVELTSYTTPCKTISGYFVDGSFQRIAQKVNPGYSRIYARVLQGGKLAVGQTVTLLNGAS